MTVNMDDLKRLHDEARAKGRQSGAFLKFAVEMFDRFGEIYATAYALQRLGDLVKIIDRLMSVDGEVTLRHDGEICVVEIKDGWTKWDWRRFEGAGLEEALNCAWSAKLQGL